MECKATATWLKESRASDDVDKVLGPFPIHAREQHFLSPAFPLNLSEPLDLEKSWPSALADGGQVNWSTAQMKSDHEIDISFPKVRWTALRNFEGWAALQHHTVARTTITVPPGTRRLSVSLARASFFAIVPLNSHITPEWYSGNIYSLVNAPLQIVPLPDTTTTTFELFVSADYEIRPHGDPRAYSDSDIPVINLDVRVQVDEVDEERVQHVPVYDVVCNFVNGFAFGDAFGLALYNPSANHSWRVESVHADAKGLQTTVWHSPSIAPTQTRVVPIRISQSRALVDLSQIPITITLISDLGHRTTIDVEFCVSNHNKWSAPLKATYFAPDGAPIPFIAVPPALPLATAQLKHTLLVLHGASVEIFDSELVDAVPRRHDRWTVIPTGRNSWGLDWHGPSSDDAWDSVRALRQILEASEGASAIRLPKDERVVLMGHSNGGQGAWWNAVRYPDQVLAVIPVAAYLKSQAYVPLSMSRASHFLDPAVRAILDTAQTPDDNDLFLSHLAHIPVLALHGGSDTNVPVWHTREYISVIKTWNASAHAAFHEYEGQDHWFPTILNNSVIQTFIDQLPVEIPIPPKFTLIAAIPAESGSLFGWTILQLQEPGKLGYLTVETDGENVFIQSTNVVSARFDPALWTFAKININGKAVQLHPGRSIVSFTDEEDEVEADLHRLGRAQLILRSHGPITVSAPESRRSAALRIANDLFKFFALQVEVKFGEERPAPHQGNFIHIAFKDPFFRQLPNVHGSLQLQTRGPGLALTIAAKDQSGLEAALRLFPTRTGIPVPDWIALGDSTALLGAGGIHDVGLHNHSTPKANEADWSD